MDLTRVDKVFRILPKEEKYYELFDVLVGAVVEGCELLEAYVGGEAGARPSVEALKAVERRGDETTRDIMARLQKSFVTPIDREDIDALAKALDDILDDAYAAASFAEVSGLGEADEHLKALCRLLLTCVREIYDAVEHLNDRDGIGEHCATVHRVETEADERYRAALKDLFAGSPDPIRVIRLKELYERVEGAIDRSEDVANILETIVIKNS
jgi:predicted phosphate transport protein (TIGR00153 family)